MESRSNWLLLQSTIVVVVVPPEPVDVFVVTPDDGVVARSGCSSMWSVAGSGGTVASCKICEKKIEKSRDEEKNIHTRNCFCFVF